ncbi:Kinase [Giardia muris]|uniref:Kinase n=1 Tax=Giardia muris TaxID=5742 RepID=A0A4Z1T4L3_GIAMU|nr:Kinase [Giardia muris]|eukprot:TNJ27469.1 Kinase [Giardia muris]
MPPCCTGSGERRALELFHLLDTEGRGYVPRRILSEPPHRLTHTQKKLLERVRLALDEDWLLGDARLSKDDFVRLATSGVREIVALSSLLQLEVPSSGRTVWDLFEEAGSSVFMQDDGPASIEGACMRPRLSLYVPDGRRYTLSTATRKFVTSEDVAAVLDAFSAANINVAGILGLSPQMPPEYEKDALSLLVLKEYDYTCTGYLNEHEFAHFLRNLLREYLAHRAFVGMDSKWIGNYLTGRTLGFGRGGIVKAAVKGDGKQPFVPAQTYALKIIPLQEEGVDIPWLGARSIPEDYAIRRAGKHRHVVELTDTFVHTDDRGIRWRAMALTFCGGGTLWEHRQSILMTEPIARYFFTQIIKAVAFIHLSGVAHLDLRAENCMLDENGVVKVCDFGNAMSFEVREGGLCDDRVKAGVLAGTLTRMPPEMLTREEDFSATKVDIWCCGLLLYELLMGKPAFRQPETDDTEIAIELLTKRICELDYEAIGYPFTAEARDLCNRMLALNPADRPSAIDILTHPWLSGPCVKPPLALGLVVLDPAPSLMEAGSVLRKALEDRRIEYRDSPDGTLEEQVLICRTAERTLTFTIILRVLSNRFAQKGMTRVESDLEMMQVTIDANITCSGAEDLEDEHIRRSLKSEAGLKATFALRSGSLFDFHCVFRGVRAELLAFFQRRGSVTSRQGSE